MNHYKIVASDLDGTLLNSKSAISDENNKAIETLYNMGVNFVPCTGRSYSELPDELKQNPNIRYYILSNGAMVYDKITNDKILTCISKQLLKNIINIINDYDVHIVFRMNGKLLADAAQCDDASYDFYNVCTDHRHVVSNYATFPDNFADALKNGDNIEEVSVFFRNVEKLPECQKRLLKYEELNIVHGFVNNLEIFSKFAGKGNAILKLADKLGIEHSDTISMGDSENDISAIKLAGLGLAVKNACDGLKQAADKIICSNDEHAVEYVLKNFFNNNTKERV